MVKAATKTCITCHACKPVNLFRKKGNQCKACIAAKGRKYRQSNREKIAAYNRKYRQNNKEEIAAKGRKYYQENKQRVAAKDRKYRQNNKDKIAARKREYQKQNKDKIAAYHREYYQENKEKRNDRIRKRRKNDPVYAITKRLRCRMWEAVKAAGLDKKCDSSSELLGISYQGLKEWLEAQFTEGMTWENRSDWHVDHRVPCDAFDMTVPEQQRICFWYKNLQPMWATRNLQKSNSYTEEEKQTLISAYCNQ